MHVDFIMMDAEGSEKHILEGMEKTLQNNPGLEIITEYNSHALELAGSSGELFLDLIEKLGFSIFVIDETDQKIKSFTKDQILKKLDLEISLIFTW